MRDKSNDGVLVLVLLVTWVSVAGIVHIVSASERAPSALSLDEQERASRLMIALQDAELRFLQAQHAADQAQAVVERADSVYHAELAKLRAAHHAAEICELRTDKTWNCPAKP